MRHLFVWLGLLVLPLVASAHHSTAGFYDRSKVAEIEGTVSAVSWRNPHTLITVDVETANGNTQTWRIETGAISILRTRGIAREFLQVGDKIKVAGDQSARGRNDIFAHNILLGNGKEVLLTVFSEPRWTAASGEGLLPAEFSAQVAERARREAEGIFRVWSTVLSDAESWPLFHGDYPLTETAQSALNSWDSKDRTQLGCPPKGMPQMMNTPLPIEFVQDGENIIIRLEELDSERVIHMDINSNSSAPGAFTITGYSTAHWDGESLVVETINVHAKRFNADGVPQSRQAHFVERFIVSADEARLDYELLASDPETFTETVERSRYFVWRPEIEVKPFECDPRTEFYNE